MIRRQGLLKNGPHKLPPCPVGLEHINRYWDKTHDVFAAKLLPGDFYVSEHGEMISTVLGSCISACIWDHKARIGGMNHFMLPMGDETEHYGREHLTSATRYGNFAMEILINEILKAGGMRSNLQVKIFGGGKVLASMNNIDIGKKNINFVRRYILQEGLHIIAEDVGDCFPRKILFFTSTGKVKLKRLYDVNNDTITRREESYRKAIDTLPVQSDVELF